METGLYPFNSNLDKARIGTNNFINKSLKYRFQNQAVFIKNVLKVVKK